MIEALYSYGDESYRRINEAAPGAVMSAMVCDHLEAFALDQGNVTGLGNVAASVTVDPSDFTLFAPSLLESNPFVNENGRFGVNRPRCQLSVESTNFERWGTRHSKAYVIFDGRIQAIGGELLEVVAVTKYQLDPSERLDSDPATGIPPKNTRRTVAICSRPVSRIDVDKPNAVFDEAMRQVDMQRRPGDPAVSQAQGREVADLAHLAVALTNPVPNPEDFA